MHIRTLIPIVIGLLFIYYGLLITESNELGASIFISAGLGCIAGATKTVIKWLNKVYEKIKNE